MKGGYVLRLTNARFYFTFCNMFEAILSHASISLEIRRTLPNKLAWMFCSFFLILDHLLILQWRIPPHQKIICVGYALSHDILRTCTLGYHIWIGLSHFPLWLVLRKRRHCLVYQIKFEDFSNEWTL